MKREKAQQFQALRGFSMLELIIVMAIILAISAFALPRIQTGIAQARLRGNATSINGLVQQLRMQAVKANRSYTMRITTAAGNQPAFLYIDTDNSTTLDPGEPSVPIPSDMTITDGTGGPAAVPPSVAFPKYINFATKGLLSFNERGLPCSNPPAAPACGVVNPYIIYLSMNRPFAVPVWAAVTVTPAGRVKAYTFTGGAAGVWN
jgi:prepilin-type N-terminal cleavage/methylation domain-containing protein